MKASARWLAAYCGFIGVLAATASAIGVFARGTGASAPATSIRGEAYRYATDGVYAFNAVRVVAEGVGWDAVTLAARAVGFPRRSLITFGLLAAALLLAMWVPRISTGLSGDLAGAGLLGTPTLAVQALDLGLVVPFAIFLGVTVFAGWLAVGVLRSAARSEPWSRQARPAMIPSTSGPS